MASTNPAQVGGDQPITRVLDALAMRECAPRKHGRGYQSRCPAHEDREPSLSIGEGDDGRVLLKCFGGCDTKTVLAALGLEFPDIFPAQARHGRQRVGAPSAARATLQPGSECTLSAYAAAKRLPVEFLRALGLGDTARDGRRALRIPYLDQAGVEVAVRFRTALEKSDAGDTRFRWRSGTQPRLYGLWKLAEAARAGYLAIVEGESDCHTLWFHGIPAIGIPGASSWKESWADHLDGIAKLYVIVEGDSGGEAMLRWLATSRIRDRAHLVSLSGAKDPSDLHVGDPEGFVAAWTKALSASRPWSEHAQQIAEARHREAEERCAPLAREPDILHRFSLELRAAGVVGEERAAMLLYLCLTSRLFDRPVSAVIKGTSAAGKSFVSRVVLKFFPPTAYYELSAMSDRALAYSHEPLRHRFLVLFEAAGLRSDLANYFLRSLLSENVLRYETVEKTQYGMRPRLITREGPAGLLLTTTALNLHPENETRMLSIPIGESHEQTQAVMASIASPHHGSPDYESWHVLQTWLEGGERRVSIPYGTALARLVPPATVRLRRDFAALLTLIRAHALLHRASRGRDEEGQIIATIEDYEAVRLLVTDIMSDVVEASVSVTVRQTVRAVERLLDGGRPHVTVQLVATELGIEKSSAHRRVRAAIDMGFLKNLEERRARPAQLVMGNPVPQEVEILPRAAEVAAASGCAVAASNPEDTAPAPPVGAQASIAVPGEPREVSDAP